MGLLRVIASPDKIGTQQSPEDVSGTLLKETYVVAPQEIAASWDSSQ